MATHDVASNIWAALAAEWSAMPRLSQQGRPDIARHVIVTRFELPFLKLHDIL
jgi:hypothetical protein